MGPMRTFKHRDTGRVGQYPDHFGELFDYLVPVDDEGCQDCGFEEVEAPEDSAQSEIDLYFDTDLIYDDRTDSNE